MAHLSLHDVGRSYRSTPPVDALQGVSLEIPPGDLVAFVGPSGSGKSTLLNVVAMLDRPTAGTYRIDDRDVGGLRERDRAALRSRTFGFVFQGFHLLDRQTAVENVETGLLYQGVPWAARRRHALDALDRVGMADRAAHLANQLSGGEGQRVAIARALVSDPPVLVADEPTGNLDSANSEAIADLLAGLHRAGKTVVLVTHDADVATVADRRLTLHDGTLRDTPPPPAARSDVPGPATLPGATGTPVAADAPPDGVTGAAGATSDRPADVPADRLRGSRVRARDLASVAWRAATARRGRAAALIATVAVASALVVTTLGLSETASAQVSEEFDLRRSREVTVRTSAPSGTTGPASDPAVPADAEERIQRLAGVRAAGVLTNMDQQTVTTGPTRQPRQTVTMAVSDGLLPTIGADIRWLPGHDGRLGPRELIVGNHTARQLQLGPLANAPAVTLDGTPYAVAGILDDVTRYPEALSALLVARDAPAARPGSTELLIQTDPGAARQVARQAPLALDPTDPSRFDASAPPDPTGLRAAVETDVTTAMLVLSAVAFVAAVIGIGNAMTMGVVERTSEFGLRRALGARPAHILGQVTVESLTLGTLGGLAGLYAGTAATLAVTLARHWQPVLDMRLAPLALAAGALAGTLGGVAAGIRASRIQPTAALRQ